MAKLRHPGIELGKMLEARGVSQREFASTINIAHPLLNNILRGNRNINVKIAISLEAAGYEDANYWLTRQLDYSLDIAKKDQNVRKKEEDIKTWNNVARIVPLNYFKKFEDLGIQSSEDIQKIFDLYKVKNYKDLDEKVNTYNPTYFRKSSKFVENKNNVLAWSMLAEHYAEKDNVATFNRSKEKNLINELNEAFYSNVDTKVKCEEILAKYGIKFVILDRPPQTPADGKSFISGKNPAIALSLKYKRLDNFAFTLMHELGHIFLHFTNPNEKSKYKGQEFFVNSSNSFIEEFQADSYAQKSLIPEELWEDFILLSYDFSDDTILEFSEEHRIHPGIVRGRVCHEYPEYYKKRTSITNLNKLT
nr:ImmA/IrrE family metallo-endopeptidase [uncultured Allomuricauda sp.]